MYSPIFNRIVADIFACRSPGNRYWQARSKDGGHYFMRAYVLVAIGGGIGTILRFIVNESMIHTVFWFPLPAARQCKRLFRYFVFEFRFRYRR
jgi:uncharacterized protein (DUF983 family)